MQNYVKHLQDTLDIFYTEVSFKDTLANYVPGKHTCVLLTSGRLSVIMFHARLSSKELRS